MGGSTVQEVTSVGAEVTATLTQAQVLALEAARSRFPGALTQSYIDVASRGLMPADVPQAAFDHLQQRVLGRADKKAYFETVETARRGVAKLLNAQPHEIAASRNVTDGLNMVANGMDWKPGDEVWLCSGVEHPSNLYTWRNLERLGVSVRDFPASGGEFPIDAVIEAMQASKSVRVVTVSATSFVPGFRTDLDRLGQACRARGVRLVVDGAQAVGITHIDLARTPVDALALSTQKGLCSVYGMGFLFVREAFANTLKPRYLSRFGVDLTGTHEADYDTGPITLQKGALRFELGNHNFLAATLVNRTLPLLNELGTQVIQAHVTALATQLADGLAALGAPVPMPRPGGRANLVSIQSARGPDPVVRLHQHLQSRGVLVAHRRNVVRFSFHFYNAQADVDNALVACKEWLAQHGDSLR